MNVPDDSANLFRFFNELGIIQQLARARLERVLPHGLTVSQFSVLNHFVRLGETSTPARLARAFQVTKGAMTNTLKRLESHRFILVQPDPRDGRGKCVDITAAGREAHGACISAMTPDLAVLGEEFGLDAFEAALPFLERVRVYLDTHR